MEVAVNGLRFRIAWVMVAVAIVAIDVAALREGLKSNSIKAQPLIVGALPMASVLAVGLLIGHQRPGSCPFLVGSEAFGAMGLAFYVVLVGCFVYEVIVPYLGLVYAPIQKTLRRDWPFISIPIAVFTCVVELGLPQLAFALIGGFLSSSTVAWD
jgi:hypothetical protein